LFWFTFRPCGAASRCQESGAWSLNGASGKHNVLMPKDLTASFGWMFRIRRSQPQPTLADREELRMAKADRTAATDEVARAGQGGLAVRLQLRGTQPAPPAQAVRSATNSDVPRTSCLIRAHVAELISALHSLSRGSQQSWKRKTDQIPRNYSPSNPTFNKLLGVRTGIIFSQRLLEQKHPDARLAEVGREMGGRHSGRRRSRTHSRWETSACSSVTHDRDARW
jgi:hypothetical protein